MTDMRYTSDVTDTQWDEIKILIPVGNKSKYEKRELLNGVLYVVKTGCQWRNLPTDFPPWKAVYAFYFRSKRKGMWERIMQYLVKKTRVKTGRNENQSYGLIDSQSVKQYTQAKNADLTGEKNERAKTTHSHGHNGEFACSFSSCG
jgi:transposase